MTKLEKILLIITVTCALNGIAIILCGVLNISQSRQINELRSELEQSNGR